MSGVNHFLIQMVHGWFLPTMWEGTRCELGTHVFPIETQRWECSLRVLVVGWQSPTLRFSAALAQAQELVGLFRTNFCSTVEKPLAKRLRDSI